MLFAVALQLLFDTRRIIIARYFVTITRCDHKTVKFNQEQTAFFADWVRYVSTMEDEMFAGNSERILQ